jgi:hypothetical protein
VHAGLGESLCRPGTVARVAVVFALAAACATFAPPVFADAGTTPPSSSTGDPTATTSADPTAPADGTTADGTTTGDPTAGDGQSAAGGGSPTTGTTDGDTQATDTPGTGTSTDGAAGSGTSTCTPTGSGDTTSTDAAAGCAPSTTTPGDGSPTEQQTATTPAPQGTTTVPSQPADPAPASNSASPAPATTTPTQAITISLASTEPSVKRRNPVSALADGAPPPVASVPVAAHPAKHVRAVRHAAAPKPTLPRRRNADSESVALGTGRHLLPVQDVVYSAPIAPAKDVSVDMGDYVTIVAPTSGPDERAATSAGAPKKLLDPPRTPAGPPSGPDSPGSVFGSPVSGSAGGAILVVAALVGLLALVRPRILTRVALLAETPLAFQRTLSLERPG